MKCVHCFIELEKETRDHVFPKSWYTDDTPSWVERWTVPSCEKCNQKFGKLEQDLFVRLVPCINPKKAEMSGITNKLLHTFEKRPHFLKWLLANSKPYTEDKKPFPGLGPHPEAPIESQLYIPGPNDLLMPVLEKIFRGVEYKISGHYIEPPLNLKIYHVFEEPEEVKRLLNFKSTASLGPGFRIERVVPGNQTFPIFYKTVIWGTLISYSSIDLIKNET